MPLSIDDLAFIPYLPSSEHVTWVVNRLQARIGGSSTAIMSRVRPAGPLPTRYPTRRGTGPSRGGTVTFRIETPVYRETKPPAAWLEMNKIAPIHERMKGGKVRVRSKAQERLDSTMVVRVDDACDAVERMYGSAALMAFTGGLTQENLGVKLICDAIRAKSLSQRNPRRSDSGPILRRVGGVKP